MSALGHIKPGDTLAVRRSRSTYDVVNVPFVKFDMHKVERTTKTMLVCSRIRVRIDDGAVLGRSFTHAIEATPQLLEEHEDEKKALTRYWAAIKAIDPIVTAISRREITVEHLEAIVRAYNKVNGIPA